MVEIYTLNSLCCYNSTVAAAQLICKPLRESGEMRALKKPPLPGQAKFTSTETGLSFLSDAYHILSQHTISSDSCFHQRLMYCNRG